MSIKLTITYQIFMDRYEERLRRKEGKKAQTIDLDYAALVMQAKNDQQTKGTTNTPE